MQIFACTHCHTRVGREQHRCPACRSRLGFVPELGILCAFEDRGEAGWHPLGVAGLGVRLPCGNYGEHPICHWTVPADASDCFCESCRCVIPTPRLAEPLQRQRWARFGRARRKLFVGLRQLGLLDAQGRLRGLPEPLFDVHDGAPRSIGECPVRPSARGPIVVDLRRLDEQTDQALFDELRRAIGLRLSLASPAIMSPEWPGGPAFDADRAIAEWDARWAAMEAGGTREAARRAVGAGYALSSPGVLA